MRKDGYLLPVMSIYGRTHVSVASKKQNCQVSEMDEGICRGKTFALFTIAVKLQRSNEKAI